MSRSPHRLCALLASVVLGCNAIAGINQPIDPPADAAAPDAAAPDSPSSFVGTWRNTGQVTALCGEQPQPTTPDADAQLMITQSDNGLVISLPRYPDCRLGFTVSGAVATVIAGQQCTFDLSGGRLRLSYSTSSTFTLTSATTAELYVFADSTLADGSGGTCTYEEGSTFQKE